LQIRAAQMDSHRLYSRRVFYSVLIGRLPVAAAGDLFTSHHRCLDAISSFARVLPFSMKIHFCAFPFALNGARDQTKCKIHAVLTSRSVKLPSFIALSFSLVWLSGLTLKCGARFLKNLVTYFSPLME